MSYKRIRNESAIQMCITPDDGCCQKNHCRYDKSVNNSLIVFHAISFLVVDLQLRYTHGGIISIELMWTVPIIFFPILFF